MTRTTRIDDIVHRLTVAERGGVIVSYYIAGHGPRGERRFIVELRGGRTRKMTTREVELLLDGIEAAWAAHILYRVNA